MRTCPKCGYKDNPQWRSSRFDFNSDYLRFEEAQFIPELQDIWNKLKNSSNKDYITIDNNIYYRRGKNGLWLYRVPIEDFKVPIEKPKQNQKVYKKETCITSYVCYNMKCPNCQSEHVIKCGFKVKLGGIKRQRWQCQCCGKNFLTDISSAEPEKNSSVSLGEF